MRKCREPLVYTVRHNDDNITCEWRDPANVWAHDITKSRERIETKRVETKEKKKMKTNSMNK